MSTHKKIVNGLNWSFLAQAYSVLSQFTFGIWLARLLGPEVYGTVAMITIFSGLAQMLLNFGFSAALIQKKNVSNIDYSTVFWFNLFISLLIYLLFYFASGYIAVFYDLPELELYTKVIAIQFLLSVFAITQDVQLTKRVDFKTKAFNNVLSSLLSYIVAIFLAYNGFGVWALICQIILTRIIIIILLYIEVSFTPLFKFSLVSFKEMLLFGSAITGESFLNYFSRNFDNFLIAKFAGEDVLGAYSKAYGLVLFPIKNLSNVVKNVLFPSFSLMQSNIKEIKNYYLKVTSFIAYIVFPLMGLVALLAEEIVLILYGVKWVKMIPFLEIFAWLGAVQAIITINGTIYLSQGKANIAFMITVFTSIVLALSIIIGFLLNGAIGVAYGLLITQFIVTYPILYTALKLIEMKVRILFNNLIRIFYVFISSLLLSYFLKLAIDFSDLLEILIISIMFVIFYIVGSVLFQLEPFLFLRRKLLDTFIK
ncbi:lipopolysaccharide biosynthesis protein [Marivirga harenae]|uniref:lipopolysaccharide biosynthesis protein n=1 Tax=Marivirga harenae TaxID=2010992 RepID=UPI0026E04E19|nr:lipopolysaccharide biosynthesis protein [Marivirga harenae]WKV11357.1 lipopolysaccharide biosynthesis protein [Marivirga harenae]